MNYRDYNKPVLNKYAPKKKKVIRGNHKQHLIKELREAVMLRSRLTNKAKKTKEAAGLWVILNQWIKIIIFINCIHMKEQNCFGGLANHIFLRSKVGGY